MCPCFPTVHKRSLRRVTLQHSVFIIGNFFNKTRSMIIWCHIVIFRSWISAGTTRRRGDVHISLWLRLGNIHCGPEPAWFYILSQTLSPSPTPPITVTNGLSSHSSLFLRHISLCSIPRCQPVTLVDNCHQEITPIFLNGGQGTWIPCIYLATYSHHGRSAWSPVPQEV